MLFKFLLETLVRDSGDLNDKIDRLQEKYDEQNDKITELETTLGEQNDEILELKRKLVTNENVVVEQNEKISELETTLGEQHDEIMELNGKGQMFMEQINTISEIESTVSALSDENLELKENIMSNGKVTAEQTEKISELELVVSELNSKISKLETAQQTWQLKVEEQTDEISDLKTKLASSEQGCKERLDHQENEMSEIEAKLVSSEEAWKEQFEEQNREISDLETKFDLSEETYQELFYEQTNKTSELEGNLILTKETWQQKFSDLEGKLIVAEETIGRQTDKVSAMVTTFKLHEVANKERFDEQADDIAALEVKVLTSEQTLKSEFGVLQTEIHQRKESIYKLAFNARLSKSQSFRTEVFVVKFDQVMMNNGGCYSSANGVFTADHSGVYLFNWAVVLSSRYWTAEVHINGVSKLKGNDNILIIHLNKGDRVQCVVPPLSAGIKLAINAGSRFVGYLLSRDPWDNHARQNTRHWSKRCC